MTGLGYVEKLTMTVPPWQLPFDQLLWGRFMPMNAFPPSQYVTRGICAWLAHPIYIGFVIIVAGVSVGSGSASGLWLVTPVTIITLVALVVGYERHDLQRRFGSQLVRPRIAFPSAGHGAATLWERVSVYLLVFLPWLIAFESVFLLGIPRDAIDSRFAFERQWPVWQWTEAIYATAYAFALLTPFVVRSRNALRRFALSGAIATCVVTLIYVCVPLIAPPRPFAPTGFWGNLLMLERASSNTVAAFPAFHVIWPLLCAQAWSSRGLPWRITYLWAFAIAISCITTGMHSLADVLFAVIVFAAVRKYDQIWEALRRNAEDLANSWCEWRFGAVRIINHGTYTGAAALIGFWIAGWLAGPAQLLPLLLIGVFGFVTSALWAQLIEGTPALLRPLGYYGGMLGGLLAMTVLAWRGMDVLVPFGALAVAFPWVQALGRLRCLVQGCCHGGPTIEALGIRYRHRRSRVVSLAGFANVPLHPAPLYSIITNVVTGILLLRLWLLGAPPAMVLGLYFILNAAARFAEESFRAEPQTPVVAGLRLYQWTAIVGLVLGVIFTTLNATPAPPPSDALYAPLLAASVFIGVVSWVITGVDFPNSNRRFARLAAADRLD